MSEAESASIRRSRRFDDQLRSASLRRALARDRREGADEDRGMRVHALDVGQGQSTLVETPAGETLLYDGGPPAGYGEPTGTYGGETVLAALDRLGVDRLDHVVVGHYDADHVGGLVPVLERAAASGNDLSVGQVYGPDPSLTETKATARVDDLLDALDAAGKSIRGVGAGDEVDLAGTTTTVLNPWDWDHDDEAAVDDQNERSVVLHVDDEASDGAALLTGDVSGATEEKVAANYPALLAEVDLLDAPYHGSARSPGALLRTCDPEVLVFSACHDAGPGHPHDQTLRAVEEQDVPAVLSTGVHESVSVSFAPGRGPRTVAGRDDAARTPEAIQQAIRPEGWDGPMVEPNEAASPEAGAAPRPDGHDDATRLVDAAATGLVASGERTPPEVARAVESGALAARLAGTLVEAARAAGLDDAADALGSAPSLGAAHAEVFEAAREAGAVDDVVAALPGEDRRTDEGPTPEVAEALRAAREDGELDRLVRGGLADAAERAPTTAVARQLFDAAADGAFAAGVDRSGRDDDGRGSEPGRGAA
jgi:beta-lactamase superfamily II metal-dependent hydrolase